MDGSMILLAIRPFPNSVEHKTVFTEGVRAPKVDPVEHSICSCRESVPTSSRYPVISRPVLNPMA